MNYIFSNVHRFVNDRDFVKALENVGFQDGDTLIFLNNAVPLDHAANFFRRFNIISLHRIHIAPTGEIKWLGEEEMLKRMDESCSRTDSQYPISGNGHISMLYLDNAGVVRDRNGNVFWNIKIEDYSSSKMPTTGFYAYNFALQCLKGGVTLVNFYGSKDNSTNKWNGHDWNYEEIVLQNVSHRISLSPSDWESSPVNIKVATSENAKTVPWRDVGESDIASLWQNTWGEKFNFSTIETPKVSVVMPIYNAECYLSEALASVLLQKAIPEIEVICIDDGSSDNSTAILGFWKNSDPRLKVIHQENQGPGVARNVGLDTAKGEYIYFLDADDRISSGDIFLHAYEQAKADKLDVLLADGSVMSENGIVMKRDAYLNRSLIPEKVFSPETLGVNLYLIAPMGPAAKLFRREFLEDENLRFPALKRSEDFPMIQLAMSLAGRIGVLLQSMIGRRIDVASSLESAKDETPLIFAEAERMFRSSLSERGLLNKLEHAADVALVIRLAYNLRKVRRFSSFKAIAKVCAEDFSVFKVKDGDVSVVSLASALRFVAEVSKDANDFDKLADIFADIRSSQYDDILFKNSQETLLTANFSGKLLNNRLALQLDKQAKLIKEVRSVRDAALKERDALKRTLGSVREVRDAALKERDILKRTLGTVRGVRDAALKERDILKRTLGTVRGVRDAALKERDTLKRTLGMVREVRDAALKKRDSLRDQLNVMEVKYNAALTEISVFKKIHEQIALMCDMKN